MSVRTSPWYRQPYKRVLKSIFYKEKVGTIVEVPGKWYHPKVQEESVGYVVKVVRAGKIHSRCLISDGSKRVLLNSQAIPGKGLISKPINKKGYKEEFLMCKKFVSKFMHSHPKTHLPIHTPDLYDKDDLNQEVFLVLWEKGFFDGEPKVPAIIGRATWQIMCNIFGSRRVKNDRKKESFDEKYADENGENLIDSVKDDFNLEDYVLTDISMDDLMTDLNSSASFQRPISELYSLTWAKLFDSFYVDGLNMAEVCRREKINKTLIRRWRKSLAEFIVNRPAFAFGSSF